MLQIVFSKDSDLSEVFKLPRNLFGVSSIASKDLETALVALLIMPHHDAGAAAGFASDISLLGSI